MVGLAVSAVSERTLAISEALIMSRYIFLRPVLQCIIVSPSPPLRVSSGIGCLRKEIGNLQVSRPSLSLSFSKPDRQCIMASHSPCHVRSAAVQRQKTIVSELIRLEPTRNFPTCSLLHPFYPLSSPSLPSPSITSPSPHPHDPSVPRPSLLRPP